jgi:hypothetical protein
MLIFGIPTPRPDYIEQRHCTEDWRRAGITSSANLLCRPLPAAWLAIVPISWSPAFAPQLHMRSRAPL